MGDIRIVWDPATGTGDLNMLSTGAVETGHDLETASLISMFTDAQADPGDAVYGTDPAGVWFVIAWLFHQRMIANRRTAVVDIDERIVALLDAMREGRPLRQDNIEIGRLGNACIDRTLGSTDLTCDHFHGHAILKRQ